MALLQCQLRIQMNEGLSQEPWLSWVDTGQKLRLLQMANRARDDGSGGTVYLFFINVLIGPIFHT